MRILAAIRREERKLEKQLGKLNHQLSGVRAAAKALGRSASRELTGVKKRVLSATGRAKLQPLPEGGGRKYERKQERPRTSQKVSVGSSEQVAQPCVR
jgi:hypothetical protein